MLVSDDRDADELIGLLCFRPADNGSVHNNRGLRFSPSWYTMFNNNSGIGKRRSGRVCTSMNSFGMKRNKIWCITLVLVMYISNGLFGRMDRRRKL